MDMNEIGATPAERVDRLVDAILAPAGTPGAAPDSRPLAGLIGLVADALPPIPPGVAFESRLAARMAETTAGRRTFGLLRQRGRLLVTGAAVSSAAVGVGVTAFAVWRSSRRQPAHRFWER
jgi:NADPH:quinone reductase-like Zn-dependent oxidoreductase